MKSKLGIGLLAFFGLIVMLLNQPLMSIPEGRLFGVPAIIIYLLAVWVLVIVVMFLAGKHSKPWRKE